MDPQHPQAQSQPLRLSFIGFIYLLWHRGPSTLLRRGHAGDPEMSPVGALPGGRANRYTGKEYTDFPSPAPPPALPTKGPEKEQRCQCSEKADPERQMVTGWAS